jgi:hypothetical protein
MSRIQRGRFPSGTLSDSSDCNPSTARDRQNWLRSNRIHTTFESLPGHRRGSLPSGYRAPKQRMVPLSVAAMTLPSTKVGDAINCPVTE